MNFRSIRTSVLKVNRQICEDAPRQGRKVGLHPVTVREIDGTCVKAGPIEAFDGTPVVDIKSASTRADGCADG